MQGSNTCKIINSTIFKTYENDIDGITNKIGFSKRSFAEWGKQVSSAFSQSQGVLNKFKSTTTAIFVPQNENNDKLIGDFQAFKDLMDETGLSAEVLAKEVGEVDSRIVRYAKSTDISKLSTDGFRGSIGNLSLEAKAGQVALKGLALVGNALAIAFASWAATEIIKWLDDLAHAEENARKHSEELTSSYESEKKSIDDSISKYEELSKKLQDTSLSTSEVKSIKEQLLGIQDELNEKYGAESTQIDLVNGKYDEQIKKLDVLAKKKARDYVAENYSDIKADQKYVSENFNVNKSLGFKGSQAKPDDYSGAGFDLKKYLDKYDKLSAKVIMPDSQNGMTGDMNLVTSGTRQEVHDQISQLIRDLNNDFGESNPDVVALKETLSDILKDSFDTSELAAANSRIKKYAEAQILSNDDAAKSYNNLVDAVDNYNTALENGKGIDDAKKKLLEAKQAAEDSTEDISNSEKVLKDVYNTLGEKAPIEFQIEIGKDVNEDLKKSYDDTINRFKANEESNLDELKQSYQEAIDKRKELYSGTNYVGNVDVNNRPVVINDDGSYSTTSTSFQEKWVGNEENGHYIIAHYTPILPDGTVLDDNSLNEYIDKILNSADPMEADKVANGGKGIVYKVDTQINGKDITDDNLEDAFGVADAWDVDMHNLQDKMYKDEAAIKAQIERFDDEVDGSQKIRDFFDTEGINTQEIIDVFNDVTKGIENADEAIQKWNEYKNTIADSPIPTKSFSESLSLLNDLETDLKDINTIVSNFKNKDNIDSSSLNNILKKFSELKEAGKDVDLSNLEKSIKQISNASSLAGAQSALDSLCSQYIKATGLLDGLTESNSNFVKVQLEAIGVTNADELVVEALAQTHADAAWNARDLSNATYDEIAALAGESEATAQGQKAYELYIAKKMLAQTPFDPSASIENLKAIVNALGIASDAWVGYYAAMDRMKQISESGETSYNEDGSIVSNQELIQQYKDIAKIRKDQFTSEIDAQLGSVTYSPKTSKSDKSGKSGSKGAKDNSTIDWISRSADLLERESKRLETALQDTWTAYTGLSEEDIERVQELFNMPLSPDSKEVDELMDYASKLGISIGELQKLSENGGLESRQSILTKKIAADQESLDQAKNSLDYYRQSYEKYVSEVPEYRDKIENGGTDIESFTSDQKAQIDKAIQAFDSWKDSEEKVKELQKTIRDEKGTYYDNIVDGATKENEKLADANDLIQKQIDLLNTQGSIVSADMYEEMMSNTEQQIDLYRQIQKTREDELYARMNDEDDPLKAGTEEWYNIMAAIMEAKGQVKSFEKELANQEKQLRELPVTNLEKLGNIYQSILDTIQNWGAEMEASGKTLDADYYQKLINNANTSISNYKEEIEAIQDVMEDYNPGTDNWNEMNDKLQQCNSSISSLVQNMHKWNEELLNLPIQKISDASDSLSKIVDGLNDVKSEHETVISAVTGAISDEIDRLNDEKEAYEDTINDQKEALQDRMDLLDKQNEKLKLQAQYEQALYDLENATTQKTEKVIRNGELTYEANADNLRNAQESVQDSLAALKKQELQDQMDALDDALDDYNDKLQDTLDSLQKISDKWSEIASKKEQQVNETTATDILGKGWKDKVLSGNDNDIFQMFSKLYSDNVDQINKYQEQIDSTEHISSLIQEYIDSYKAGTLTYEEAQAGIHDLVSQMNQKMSAMDNLQNIYNYMGKVYDTAANGDAVFGGIQKAFKESGDQLISSLEQYQANAGLISESMSSWQQLTNNVESIKDILEDVKDNLKDTERDSDSKKDKDDNVRGSGNSRATGKHSSKSVYGSSGFSAEKHHSGVFSGAVGSSSADKTDKIRVLEAEKLEPNEVPAVLERGEMVFTPEQMEKLVASFSATAYVPDNSWIKNMYPSATVNTKPNIVNVSVGDVKLTDVRDVDGFAKAMGRDFVPLARQALARF